MRAIFYLGASLERSKKLVPQKRSEKLDPF